MFLNAVLPPHHQDFVVFLMPGFALCACWIVEVISDIHISCWWVHAQAYNLFFLLSHLLYSVLFYFNCGSCCPLYLKKNYEFAVWCFLSVHHHLLLMFKLPVGVTQSDTGGAHCMQVDLYLSHVAFLLAWLFVSLLGRLLLLPYLIICLVSTQVLVSHWSSPTQSTCCADR